MAPTAYIAKRGRYFNIFLFRGASSRQQKRESLGEGVKTKKRKLYKEENLHTRLEYSILRHRVKYQ